MVKELVYKIADMHTGGREIGTLQTLRPTGIVAIHPESLLAKGDKLEDIYNLITDCDYHITVEGNPCTRDAFCATRHLINLQLTPSV